MEAAVQAAKERAIRKAKTGNAGVAKRLGTRVPAGVRRTADAAVALGKRLGTRLGTWRVNTTKAFGGSAAAAGSAGSVAEIVTLAPSGGRIDNWPLLTPLQK